jgi:hypothetical protein
VPPLTLTLAISAMLAATPCSPKQHGVITIGRHAEELMAIIYKVSKIEDNNKR